MRCSTVLRVKHTLSNLLFRWMLRRRIFFGTLFRTFKRSQHWPALERLGPSLPSLTIMPQGIDQSEPGLHVVQTIASLLKRSGGPTHAVTGLCTELGRQGVHVDLISQAFAAQGGEENLLPTREWVTTTLVAARRLPLGGAVWSPQYRVALWQRCEQRRNLLLHDNGLWLPTNHAVATVARKLRIPLIISTHGMLQPWAIAHRAWKKRVVWRLYQRTDLLTACILHATAQHEAETLRRLGFRQPIAVIPNGVHFSASHKEQKPRESCRVALFVGRIHPVKGLAQLVDVWSRVRPVGWRMIIAGPDEGGHRAEVEKRIRVAGLSAEFQFLGPVGDGEKNALYHRAELFVLPSFTENFGVAAAEALACGVPVITTKGAPWQGLETHRCGWWVDLGLEPLVSALREATATPPDVLKAMGLRGRAYAEGAFGWPGIAREMLAVYRWMLGQGERPECVQLDSE